MRGHHATIPDDGASPTIGEAAFRDLSRRLQAETGIVLSDSKRGLAVSRLTKRLRHLGLADFDAYCTVLDGPDGAVELQEMIQNLTTNVTRFFREEHHFERLRAVILPPLVRRAQAGGRVRIWSAGCSSGEEAFSIAMCVAEILQDAHKLDIRILATDIDRRMIAQARRGQYRLSNEDMDAHPLLSGALHPVVGLRGTYEISENLQKLVQFADLNLLAPWPMQGKFDVIFCRNVVIYFGAETQQELWKRFADTLMPGGKLMIGHSERVIGPASHLLQPSGATEYENQPERSEG